MRSGWPEYSSRACLPSRPASRTPGRSDHMAMSPADLERFYDYHYWANRHLLGVVSSLTTEQFTRTVAGSYGSVRNTLVHVLSAERGWLERCGGPARGPKLDPVNYPTVESLVHEWTRVEAQVRA